MHSYVISDSKFQTPNPNSNILIITPDKSVGIGEVRQIQIFLAKKPLAGKNQVYVLQAELLTIPAQNALLKTLEEPPGGSEIFLVTDFPDQLLPTILSRVQIVAGQHKSYASNTTDMTDLTEKLLAATIGERLLLLEAQEFKRPDFLKFLDEMEHAIHRDRDKHQLFPIVLQTRKYLKANCNLKLCLTYLATHLR